MFDKMKQLKKVYELQQQLKSKTASATFEGVTVKMNGKMEVLEIHLNPELDQRRQERALIEAFRDAMRQIQKIMSEEMKGMQGLEGLGL